MPLSIGNPEGGTHPGLAARCNGERPCWSNLDTLTPAWRWYDLHDLWRCWTMHTGQYEGWQRAGRVRSAPAFCGQGEKRLNNERDLHTPTSRTLLCRKALARVQRCKFGADDVESRSVKMVPEAQPYTSPGRELQLYDAKFLHSPSYAGSLSKCGQGRNGFGKHSLAALTPNNPGTVSNERNCESYCQENSWTMEPLRDRDETLVGNGSNRTNSKHTQKYS
eukprot:1195905-Prorocentrum_minimum.AAC.6